MSGVGKDGSRFDLARWVDWAASPATNHSRGLKRNKDSEATGRKRGTVKMKRRGGPRYPCECGRMNHRTLLVCKCGKVLRAKVGRR